MKRGEGEKFLSAVKLGPKGQIVIPKEVRDMFALAPGDTLVLMADKRRGIALQTAGVMRRMVDQIFAGQEELSAEEAAEHRAFAELADQTLKEDGN